MNRDLSNNAITYDEYKENLSNSHGPDIDTIKTEFYSLMPAAEEEVAAFMDRVISMGNIGKFHEL